MNTTTSSPKSRLQSFLKNLRWNRKAYRRIYTDFISWTVFFILTLTFCFLYLWFRFNVEKGGLCYENFVCYILNDMSATPDFTNSLKSLSVVIKDSLGYTLIMMMPVYINLGIIKPKTLDRRPLTKSDYLLYLILIIVNALFFAGIIYMIEGSVFRTEIQLPINILTIAGVQLVATGLLNKRELLNLSRRLDKLSYQVEKKSRELMALKEQSHPFEEKMVKPHIKSGSAKKYWIIPLDIICYLKAAGNEPFIYTNDEKGKYSGDQTLGDYENELPGYLFLRVHRSYLVAKDKVIGRSGNELILQGGTKIPIGATYEKEVDRDWALGFHNNEIPEVV